MEHFLSKNDTLFPERSVHIPLVEEPGRARMACVKEVLPLVGGQVQFERLADAPE